MNARIASALVIAAVASGAHAQSVVFDLAAGQSVGTAGAAGNTSITLQAAPGARVTAVSWNVSVTTTGASRASESTIALTATDPTRALDVRPFACDFFAGATASSQTTPLSITGGPLNGRLLFTTLANGLELRDGLLTLELFEGFDDNASGVESVWSGSVTVFYEPNGFCVADWNYDGGVDSDDVIAYFADWDVSNADYNGDGGTDGDDIIAFFGAWDAGC
ncbi:MAG: hypothetical protein ACOYN0_05015 [Phycisphaerales bacterium]